MTINVAGFLGTLPYMAAGLVGIFAVTGVIILTIFLLNKLTQGKNKNQ
ncbi:MAG: oxaloacetate decarboxylase [Ruminococcaceae bacterium]|nr:oxaloacetate decarboxylase [Oscillospiraceae bacterium]